MGSLRQLVESRRDEIVAVVRRHKGRSVSIFGSVARGEEHPGSDIDFLVQFETGSSLFDLMDLEAELAELLGVHVDVISAGGLKDRDHHIREEAVSLA
ncbi:MAG: nucleotidyltransferase family protein [Acidimicrobiales bacterium]